MQINIIDSAWYREGRAELESVFQEGNHVLDQDQMHVSPSGRYRLVERLYDARKGTTKCSRGLVYAGARLVADVKRNLEPFFFGWAESHPTGHDYLLCGEDYQGQTVIELDTGRRADFIPDDAQKGRGFCCAKYHPSPDGSLVVIDGCYWGASYDLVVCRFEDPMRLPWPEVERIDFSGEPAGWTDEGFVYETAEDIRVADGKAFSDFTPAEQDEWYKHRKQLGVVRQRRCARLYSGEKRVLDERIISAR